MLRKLSTYRKKLLSKITIAKLTLAGARIGKNSLIFSHCEFYNCQNLVVGDNFFANDWFWCNAKGGVTIGNNVIVGPGVVIHSSNHNFERLDIPIREQGHTDRPVVIKDNVWIGARAIILPGVTICSGAVIAAGAVVSKSVTEPGVYGGVPATMLKVRR